MEAIQNQQNPDIIGNVVYQTTDYGKFKHLNGNRTVLEPRVKKLIKSIKENGYILNPAIVNEVFEVVDGQGRIEALKRLGMPVDYIVVPGLTKDDCAALNLYGTSWTLLDYVESYADVGDANYIRFRELLKMFPKINRRIVYGAAIGSNGVSGGFADTTKKGYLICTQSDYETAIRRLRVINNLLQHISDRRKGNVTYVSSALLFAMGIGIIDIDRLEDRIVRYFATDVVKPFTTVEGAILAVEACYNYRIISANRVNLLPLYEEYKRINKIKGTQRSAATKRRKKS